jgi:hypothetical protein
MIIIWQTLIAIALLHQADAQARPPYVVAERILPNNQMGITLTNVSETSIVAFHASSECASFKWDMDQDSLLQNAPLLKIGPGLSHSFQFPTPPDGCGVKVDAVLFADGSSGGDETAVDNIYAHRDGLQDELKRMRPQLVSAATGALREDGFRVYLSERRMAIRNDTSETLAKKRGRLAALSQLDRQLSTGAIVETPNRGQTSSDAPDFVTRCLSSTKFVDDWQAKLEASQKGR